MKKLNWDTIMELAAILTVFTFLFLSLMGCAPQGESGQSQAATASSTPSPTPVPILIYMEGDSTMAGADMDYPPNNVTPNPPPLLTQNLFQSNGLNNVTTVNMAAGGSMLSDSLLGTPAYGNQTLEYRLAHTSAQIVVTNSSHNEVEYYYNDGMTKDQAVMLYSQNLEIWIQTVLQAGKIPVLQEPNPSWMGCGGTFLPNYIAVQHQLAAKYNITVISIYDQLSALPNWFNLLSDGCVHPDDQMYAMIAQAEYQALLPIVQNLQKGQ